MQERYSSYYVKNKQNKTEDALVPTGLSGVLFQKHSYSAACGAVLTYKPKKISKSGTSKEKSYQT